MDDRKQSETEAPTLAALFERIAEAANEPSHDLALRLTGIRLMALEAKRIAEERGQ